MLLFDVASVLRATVFLAFRCYGGAVVASVLRAKDAFAFRCKGSASLRANEGRRKPLGDDFRLSSELLGLEKNSFSLKTLSELHKTLPRAPQEVPGASRRPLRSGPRRFQRHLSSARGLRSTSEAALRAFRARFGYKFRAPSLLFFVLSCPWPLLSGLVWSVFCCFCSTLLWFCVPQFSWPFVATEVHLLLLF